MPSRSRPRSARPSRAAGAEVILRTASSRLVSRSSRTNSPRMRGKVPYVRGAGLSAIITPSVPTIDDRVLPEGDHAGLVRPGRDLVDAQVLGQEQVADGVDGVLARVGHHVGQGPALPARVLGSREGAESQVRPGPVAGEEASPGRHLVADARPRGAVGQALLEPRHAAGLDPRRQHDQQARARPLVGVEVEGHVEPLVAGVVDQAEQLLGRARVVPAVVEVRDVDGTAATAPADLDRLAERVEEAIAQVVADVRVVDATEPRGLRQERGQLLGRGIGAGWVVEPAREPEGPLLHALAQERALAVHGPRVGLDLVPADGRDAQRRVADDVGHVDADLPVEAVEVVAHRAPVVGDVRPAVEAGVERQEVVEVMLVRERGVAVAVDPDDLGRDALADLRLVPGLGQHRQAGVAVEVDETRRHDEAGRVDPARGVDVVHPRRRDRPHRPSPWQRVLGAGAIAAGSAADPRRLPRPPRTPARRCRRPPCRRG